MKTAELVFIPFTAVGHLVSAIEIAKLLVSRNERLSVTVLVMKLPFDTSAHPKPFSDDTIAERIRFVDLLLDDFTKDLLAKNPASFFKDFVDLQKPQVRQIVSEIMANGSGSAFNQLAGFVIDMFCTPMMDVADEFGVPTYVFFTSSASLLSLIFHLYTLQEDLRKDMTEFKDSDAELSVPSFSNAVPAKVLPSGVLDKKIGSNMFINIAARFKKVKAILVNTFDELESHALKSLQNDGSIPPVYPVGPILNLHNNKSEGVLMSWLDNQPPASVVFLCFGSMGCFDGDQVKEIAHALERTGHRFLWSLRRRPNKSKIEMPVEYDNPQEVLPEGFTERTAELGRVIGWAPQVAVLSHPAVGGFVSHYGWNLTLESLWFGVPVATWPMYAEQQMNAFQMVRVFGLAVEIKLDYRNDFRMTTTEIVTAEVIENGIRRLMEGDKSVEIRRRVKEMSEKSKITMAEGGSSHSCLGCFIQDVVNNVS
ncbi:unnamed protein product [Thlaspi arvense]|uniref:Glycosyltransferase n=1 Tax=Thlaspi arvense TaxID=13288 RepID=A0AAU9S4N5_THLAR|nr:unnamed protein product [Thlaspi arvense]